MFYPAKFTAEEGGYTVTFRDIPEAITCGDDMTDAREMAADALLTAMDFYFDDVALPASVYAKVLLLNEMLAQNIGKSELARRLETTPQEVTRITSLHHATKIDTLASALAQLGKRLTIGVTVA